MRPVPLAMIRLSDFLRRPQVLVSIVATVDAADQVCNSASSSLAPPPTRGAGAGLRCAQAPFANEGRAPPRSCYAQPVGGASGTRPSDSACVLPTGAVCSELQGDGAFVRLHAGQARRPADVAVALFLPEPSRVGCLPARAGCVPCLRLCERACLPASQPACLPTWMLPCSARARRGCMHRHEREEWSGGRRHTRTPFILRCSESLALLTRTFHPPPRATLLPFRLPSRPHRLPKPLPQARGTSFVWLVSCGQFRRQ